MLARRTKGPSLVAFGLTALLSADAGAQAPGTSPETAAVSAAGSTTGRPLSEGGPGLAGLFGAARTDQLLHSADIEERLQGLARATSAHSVENLGLLLRFRDDGPAGGDARTLLGLVRALAEWTERPAVRAELLGIVRDPARLLSSRAPAVMNDPVVAERVHAGRVSLARAQAAMALARSRHPDAIKALFEIIRDNDAARAVAVAALAAFPPEASVPVPPNPTAATIDAIADLSDLRTRGAALGAARSSDPSLRVGLLAALVGFGERSARDNARLWRHDPDLAVRVAAVATLVRVADAEAAQAVEELIGKDETAAEGLRLALAVQSEGVTKAASARAIASANPAFRVAAVAALAHQSAASAPGVLRMLAVDPFLAGPAAEGLARSPSVSALAAIEELSARTASRRLAARAYFVRRYTRGDRSARLDTLLDELGRSSDARDRAVAVEAKVALGERSVDEPLRDPDPGVRRAATLGAMSGLTSDTADVLLQRMSTDSDAITRTVLSGALAGCVSRSAPSSAALNARAVGGQPDAPLAAYVLGQRDDGTAQEWLEALYAFGDPIIRAHALRGLGASSAPDATARLAAAYRWEADGGVRRAIIEALAARPHETASAIGWQTLDLAAGLDPDARARSAARRALAGNDEARPPAVPEVAWMVLAPVEGASLPSNVAGLLVPEDGLARPFAFDDDGFALLPGVSAGEAELRLAARLPPYSPGVP
jgi:hypothetical protein